MSNLIHAEEESTSITKNVVIGISVSLIANMMIALSFVAKKYGLIRTLGRGQRPIDGGLSYLRDPIWWVGMILMATGEILNFVSYMFAPAIVITPLSSLSITASVLLGVVILREKIYRKQILGCALILGGTMILIIITPRSEDTSLESLKSKIFSIYYGLYVLGVGVTVFTLIKILSLKKYKRSLMAHVFICSILGTITISSCKSLGIIIKSWVVVGFKNIGLTLLFVAEIILSVIIQINYFNRVLDVHPLVKVTPVYFTLFNLFVIVFNAIMFPSHEYLKFSFAVGAVIAILSINTGVFMVSQVTPPN